jgi:hypothetical protein
MFFMNIEHPTSNHEFRCWIFDVQKEFLPGANHWQSRCSYHWHASGGAEFFR